MFLVRFKKNHKKIISDINFDSKNWRFICRLLLMSLKEKPSLSVRIFNEVWRILGWIIGSIISGGVGVLGFLYFIIPGFERPITDGDLFWVIFKYPGLLFFSFIAICSVLLSIVCLIGIFKPSWSEKYWED